MPVVEITASIESYRNFLNDDWGERINVLTANTPKLSEIVLDILMEWRAAAYTASLPVSILEHMRAYHDGFVNTGEINTTLLRVAEGVIGKLARKVPELTAEPSLIRRLQKEIVILGAELEAARDGTEIEFPMDETWRSYLEKPAYQLSLWGSQRICYVSIYNSYENFLVRSICIARSMDTCRSSDKDFKKYLGDTFGNGLREKCWTSNEVNIARLARHALSHAGGRVTEQLEKQKHGFLVRDGRIQITPEKTKALFSLLKDSVYALAERAVTMRRFR
ncbi:MAG TPA: hypothetical protein VG056_10715 [Pirellulales bacterium]|jgi:hypothetical protein|nr:hypothetical protein [Pirellulales bacterium]